MKLTSHVKRLTASMVVAIALAVAAVSAQTPVVLIHGIFSGDSGWDTVAQRLSSLNVTVYSNPGNYQGSLFEIQAATVNQTYGSLPGNTIAVGHSNGGIVAREWSQFHTLGGVVTIGSPHQGAPLMHQGNMNDIIGYTRYLVDSLVGLGQVFASCWGCQAYGYDGTWDCIWDAVGDGVYAIADSNNGAAGDVFYSIFVATEPVALEMDPNVAFFSSVLNTGSELARERNGLSTRVDIASMAHNYKWGGVLRAARPDYGDDLAYWRDTIRDSLEYYKDYLRDHAYFQYDFHARQLSAALGDAAGALSAMDQVWCADVSFPSNWPTYGVCTPNDTIVPTWSSGGWWGLDHSVDLVPISDGPAHIQMRKESGAYWIHYALTTYGHIPPVGPPPPPPPPPGGGGDTTTVNGGAVLYPEQSWFSPNGRFALKYQSDGNFVLYDNGGAVWAINCLSSPCTDYGFQGNPFAPGGYATMQTDGNLVAYNSSGGPSWHAWTFGNPGAYLSIGNDGSLAVKGSGGNVLWQR